MNGSLARRRRIDLVVLALCTVLVAGSLLAWTSQRSEPRAAPAVTEFGVRPSAAPQATAPADPANVGPDDRTSGRSAAADRSGRSTGTPTEVDTFGLTPALLVIPTLDIAAEVDRVGVQDDGQVQIPEDGRRIGWYRFGAAPGTAAGSTVLVGHRDTQAQGPGAMYRLGELRPGDEVRIVREDWTTLTYSVVARDALSKSAFPGDELFRRDGPPVLTLITCGGTYTPGQGYSDNVVVTAVPSTTAA